MRKKIYRVIILLTKTALGNCILTIFEKTNMLKKKNPFNTRYGKERLYDTGRQDATIHWWTGYKDKTDFALPVPLVLAYH